MNITVYSKPRCVQCDATARFLDNLGAAYLTIDVTEDVQSLQYVIELGYQQVPVVVTPDGHWSGYRPDRLKAAVQQVAVAAN